MAKKLAKSSPSSTSSAQYGGVVYELRRALNLSQNQLAVQIGVSPVSVARWEGGQRNPSRAQVIKMLSLCADPETRASFGMRFELSDISEQGGKKRILTPDQQLALRCFNDASIGINILYELAEAGHAGALEALREIADRINKRAGDWRRLKYSQVRIAGQMTAPEKAKSK